MEFSAAVFEMQQFISEEESIQPYTISKDYIVYQNDYKNIIYNWIILAKFPAR